MMNVRITVMVVGIALLIAAAVLVAARNRRRPLPPPDAHVASTPRAVQVKAVEGKVEASAPFDAAEVSAAVAIICGGDPATADRYEARNSALLSIARRRNLPNSDIAVLMAYLRSTNDLLRVERVAALKNDVMNLLRNQDPPPEGLVETLISMLGNNLDNDGQKEVVPGCSSCFRKQTHPSAVLDYCVQHLGAMVNELDDAARGRVREVLVSAARQTKLSYAGTALYSLADDRRATLAQKGELKRLTLALCGPEASSAARIAAIQLAGDRGYRETLPVLRETLSGERRDAVLDIVAIGSLGLLGNEGDMALLEGFAGDSRRASAVESAMRRIKERVGPVDGKQH